MRRTVVKNVNIKNDFIFFEVHRIMNAMGPVQSLQRHLLCTGPTAFIL